MIRIAHIINPFHASPGSDLFRAQPVTFETMRIAKERAGDIAAVELLSAQFPEDESMVPEGFTRTKNLDRSVLDYGSFSRSFKLPLIADILQRLYDGSSSDYLIYTNVDIALYPDFYRKVVEFIERGHDAFIINRRRIPDHGETVDDIDSLYSQAGKPHPGFDCFVFHRSIFPKMKLHKVCIGVPFIEISLSQNLFCLAGNFHLFDKEHLTFHLGMEIFKRRVPREYFRYNRKEYYKVIAGLDPFLDSRKFPYSNLILPARLIKWGLHPCIPISLALKLEGRRFVRI